MVKYTKAALKKFPKYILEKDYFLGDGNPREYVCSGLHQEQDFSNTIQEDWHGMQLASLEIASSNLAAKIRGCDGVYLARLYKMVDYSTYDCTEPLYEMVFGYKHDIGWALADVNHDWNDITKIRYYINDWIMYSEDLSFQMIQKK